MLGFEVIVVPWVNHYCLPENQAAQWETWLPPCIFLYFELGFAVQQIWKPVWRFFVG